MKSPEIGVWNSIRALENPDSPGDTIRRVLTLLRTGKHADAVGMISQLGAETPLDRVWKDYLEARLLAEQGNFLSAKKTAQRSASIALSVGPDQANKAATVRVAAAALELEGLCLRRADQPEAARRVHLVAYSLRNEHGTEAEQCESATGVGLCAESLGKNVEAQMWLQRAASVPCTNAATAKKKSFALFRLSTLFTSLSRHEEAVQAAQTAQNTLADFLPDDLSTISAFLQITQARLRQIEKLVSENSERAGCHMDEVFTQLGSTREELSAFGSSADADLAWCDEQLHFLDRLRYALMT